MLTKVKKSFTLVELLIVIVLISATYFLLFSTSSFNFSQDKQIIKIDNLKADLLGLIQEQGIVFENKLNFVCIEDEFTCYLKVDGNILEDIEVKNFFKTFPLVYKYQKEEERIEFKSIEINNINFDVIFEYVINSDYKTNEFILDTQEEKVYIFNSIFNSPKTFTSLIEAFDTFNLKIEEVKDAF